MAESRICKIDGCDKPSRFREWCNGHYRRWKRHGDPLAGGPSKAPKGELLRYYREVVVNYDGDECLIWPYGRGGNGYASVRVDGKPRYVHRLSCAEANGAPPTPDHDAAHNCGKGHLGCVAKRHLRWATAAENLADMALHGTELRGERHGSARLTNNDVRAIRAMRGTVTQNEIAALFCVDQSTISNIHRGRLWRHLE